MRRGVRMAGLAAFCVGMAILAPGGALGILGIWLAYALSMGVLGLRAARMGEIKAALPHFLAMAGAALLLTFARLIEARTIAWYILNALAGLIGGALTKGAADSGRGGFFWFLAGALLMPGALVLAHFVPERPAETGITEGKLSRLSGSRAFARVEPWLYLAPFLAGLLVFTLYPVVNVVFLSFKQDYSYLTRTFSGWSAENYRAALGDKYFIQAIRNTFVYAVCVVPASTAIAVVAAYLLNQKLRGAAIFQTAFFMPMVTSITAVGLAWKLMFNKNFGIINYALSFLGIDKVAWLDSADWRVLILTLVIFGIWNILPFTIILLLSGLQNIDPQYYTAARIDGAKGARIFFRITVPLLMPTIFLVSIVNTISSFKVFSELYPLFKGSPGPYNNLYTVVYYIRHAMMDNRAYGIAAAAAIILFLFILFFTMLQLYIQRRMRRQI